MNYYEMLNRVAFQNAMLKMANSVPAAGDSEPKNAPADTGAEGGEAKKGEEGEKKDNPPKDPPKDQTLWEQGMEWVGKNKPLVGGVAAGIGAGVPTAALSYYGLSQIPYFRQRRLLNWLTSGILGATAGGTAGYFANNAVADAEASAAAKKKEEEAAAKTENAAG